MGYNKINLGNQPNDGLGDSGRAGGAKINAMFKELYEQSFINSEGVRVTRTVSAPGIEDLTSYRADDKCERWEDTATKDVWIEGIVLDPTGFSFDDDIYDDSKFFITNKKLRT